MKVASQYEKIGKCSQLEQKPVAKYHFCGETQDNGLTMFKDTESWAKTWREPCYVPSCEFTDGECIITKGYDTHKTLLRKCCYNIPLCDWLFERLNGQQPKELLKGLTSSDYASFWSFVEVGKEVFWFTQPWVNIPMQFGKVLEIESEPKDWTLKTRVWLELQNFAGAVGKIQVSLRNISQTDIKLKMKKW